MKNRAPFVADPQQSHSRVPASKETMTRMSFGRTLKQRWKWLLLLVPLAIVALVVGGTYIYIHFISPDPAPRLTFSSVAASTRSSGSSASGVAPVPASGSLDGTWSIAAGSKVQYRVQEVLNGQDNEATGTSTGVTGEFALAGTTIDSASFTVDMKTFSSGESQRDNQFRNRIMETSQFPTATFVLTSPITLDAIPDDLVEISIKATGNLTLHGTTKQLTIDMKARRNGAQIELNGTVLVTFSDYGINNPSGGPAQVGDDGEMEFLLLLARA
jgi:polyisoprenoid-binding protein YceI